jgi:hypothetical protein
MRNTLTIQGNEVHCICPMGGRHVQVLIWGKQPSEQSCAYPTRQVHRVRNENRVLYFGEAVARRRKLMQSAQN